MTELYARVPLWLGLDGGVRALPPSARLALYDVALAGGSIRCGADPSRALDALSPGAGASLDELCSLGVIAVVDGHIALVAPDGQASEVGASRTSVAPIDRAPTAPLDRRALSKRLAARWSERGLRTVDARSAWIGSEQGRSYLDSLGVSADEALAIASTAGRRGSTSGATKSEPVTGATRGTPGARHVATDVATNVATAIATNAATAIATEDLPSALPSEERRNPTKKEPLEERATNSAATSHGATNGGATNCDATSSDATSLGVSNRLSSDAEALNTSSAPSRSPITTPTNAPSSSTTTQPRVAASDSRLRDDDPLTIIAEASDGGVSGIAAAHVRMELVTFATANSLSREDFERVGRLLSTESGRRKAWPWMKEPQRSVSAAFLRGREGAWTCLSSAILVARPPRNASASTPSPAPASRPGPIASADFIRRVSTPQQEVINDV